MSASPGEIERARERFRERKNAAGVDNNDLPSEEVTRLVFSGLDLDLAEIQEAAREVILTPTQAMMNGVPPSSVLLGQWVDGVAIGLLIAEERAEKAAAEDG